MRTFSDSRILRPAGMAFFISVQPASAGILPVNLYKEYSYLILNELEGLPYFGVMIWQPS